MARKRIHELSDATTSLGRYAAIDAITESAAPKILWPYHIVSELPASPVEGMIYHLTTAATVYPEGLYQHNGTGWKCVAQHSDIALTAWADTAISLTLVAGVTYTVTATAEPTSLAIDLLTSGEAMIIKTGAFAIPEPTSGSKLTATGLDALADTVNDVQIIIEKNGTGIISSAAEIVAL
jgi:hypothetical protein